jgi:segregation and condensation protein B
MSRMRQKRKARALATEEAHGAQVEAGGAGGDEPVIEEDPEAGDEDAEVPDIAEDADAGIDHEHEEEDPDAASAAAEDGDAGENADAARAAEDADAGETDPDADLEPVRGISPERLKLIIESLLFASDKPLNLPQLRHLSGERNLTSIQTALDALVEDYRGRGVVLGELAGGYQFRTHPSSAEYVQRLIAGRPVRLSRAQLETLAIIAYRQPVTRPEIDEIRGVDCGGTLKLLLDRSLIRVLGKKEEPGRPLLYGTSKEFLEFFNLKELRDLPTLREFHELSEESMRQVEKLDAETGDPEEGSGGEGGGEGSDEGGGGAMGGGGDSGGDGEGSDDGDGGMAGEEPDAATGAAAASAE